MQEPSVDLTDDAAHVSLLYSCSVRNPCDNRNTTNTYRPMLRFVTLQCGQHKGLTQISQT